MNIFELLHWLSVSHSIIFVIQKLNIKQKLLKIIDLVNNKRNAHISDLYNQGLQIQASCNFEMCPWQRRSYSFWCPGHPSQKSGGGGGCSGPTHLNLMT